MSRKLLLSLSALALGLTLSAAPRVAGQVFVGTSVPPQFAGSGQPSSKNGEWPMNGADLNFTRYSPLDQISSPVLASSATTERRVPAGA